jgi:hypothetical protein
MTCHPECSEGPASAFALVSLSVIPVRNLLSAYGGDQSKQTLPGNNKRYCPRWFAVFGRNRNGQLNVLLSLLLQEILGLTRTSNDL